MSRDGMHDDTAHADARVPLALTQDPLPVL